MLCADAQRTNLGGRPFTPLYGSMPLNCRCPVQVACLSAAPLEEGAAAAALVAVGTWDRNVYMLALPSLAAACPAEALGGDVIPRRHIHSTPFPYLWVSSRAPGTP